MSETSIAGFPLSAPETQKRLIVTFGALAGLALGLGAALGRPFVGVGIYVVSMSAAMVTPHVTEVTLFDERDDTIHRRASGITLTVFGWLAALVFPSLVVLAATTSFQWGPTSTTLAWTTVAVYVTYGLALLSYRGR